MSYIYVVELMHSRSDDIELLGKFESLIKSYDYIEIYSNSNGSKMIMEYKHLSDDQRKGSIIAINNLKRPTKFINVRADVNRRRKLTM
jgi:hypothetical protein